MECKHRAVAEATAVVNWRLTLAGQPVRPEAGRESGRMLR